MSITAEGLRSRWRRAHLSQDNTTVNHENHRQNGLRFSMPRRPQNPLALATMLPLWRFAAQPGIHSLVLFRRPQGFNPLPPLPTCIQQLVAETSFDIARYSRELNYLFALSAIGVSGLITSGWSRYTGDAIRHSNLLIVYTF
jgi:hypothetical protein